MKLEDVYAEFQKRLSDFGHVVIAGGAVRDTLMGLSPKDWDVFVLQNGVGFDEIKKEISKRISDLTPVPPKVEWHNSEPYLVATIQWNGEQVQILVNPAQSVDDLISTFDWNVCLFAYDGAFHCKESIENIGHGKSIKLNSVTFPASTLRRGYRFSERFLMQLDIETVVRLCRMIVAKADVKNNVGLADDGPSLAPNNGGKTNE